MDILHVDDDIRHHRDSDIVRDSQRKPQPGQVAGVGDRAYPAAACRGGAVPVLRAQHQEYANDFAQFYAKYHLSDE